MVTKLKILGLLVLSMFYIGCYSQEEGHEFIQKKYPDAFTYTQHYNKYLVIQPCGELLEVTINYDDITTSTEPEIVAKVKLKSCDKVVK
jgi:hypothetical protein